MLAAFRALGGVAENVQRALGPIGYGLYPIDPARPVRLHTPRELLVDVQHVRFVAGQLRVDADASELSPEAIGFFEAFEAAFSWGEQTDCGDFVDALDGAPQPLLDLMTLHLGLLAPDAGQTRDERVQQRFLQSRAIRFQKTRRLMPVIELANHSPTGEKFSFEEGIGLGGQFEGEVFARYRNGDALGCVMGYGFASDEPNVFSLKALISAGQRALSVRRSHRFPQPSEDVCIVFGGRMIDISRVLLADRNEPERPRVEFKARMQSIADVDADRLFDHLVEENIGLVRKLAEAASGWPGALGDAFRTACAYQLALLERRPE
jgi:hypothetical protein